MGGIAVGDLNGDGKLDILVSSATGTVQIGYGNGDGTFTSGPIITKSGANSLTVADVNGDGLPDIAVSSIGVLVFLNQGSGVFGPYSTLLPGDTIWSTAVGDLKSTSQFNSRSNDRSDEVLREESSRGDL